MNIGKRSDDKTNKLKSLCSKKYFLLSFFLTLLIISLSLISAVQINMKSEYSQDETLIAKITGNFIDVPSSGNIFFYRGHVRIPMQFTITKIESDYYLYALLSGKSPNNYSLQIENVEYKIGTQIYDNNIVKNFTITNTSADFYVAPGFVKTADDFSLELTNLRDESINIEVTYDNSSDSEKGFFESLFGTETSTKTVELSSGQTDKITFDFASLSADLNESDFKTITLKTDNTSYEIPVYLDVENSEVEKETDMGKLDFEPLSAKVSIATNSSAIKIFYLYNREEFSVKNISLYVSDKLKPYVSVSPSSMSEIENNSSEKIELTISSGKDEINLSGQLIAKYENLSNSEDIFATTDIFLNFIKDYVPTKEDNVTVINQKTCLELKGNICNTSTQTCPEEKVIYTKDGNCCTVQCEDIEKSSSTGKYIGWAMVALVVLFVVWFFLKKYRRSRQPVDLLKAARGK
jgi:hypothetical protein